MALSIRIAQDAHVISSLVKINRKHQIGNCQAKNILCYISVYLGDGGLGGALDRAIYEKSPTPTKGLPLESVLLGRSDVRIISSA